MDPALIRLIVVGGIGIVVTLLTVAVSARMRRAPTMERWKAARAGMLFAVTTRLWQRVVLRVTGVVIGLMGALFTLAWVIDDTGDDVLGMGLFGVGALLGGAAMLWLAHALHRMRLEVTRDILYAIPRVGAPKEAPVRQLTELAPLTGDRFGGIVLRTANGRLFAPQRTFSGYAELIAYLRATRPDLPIPEASLPFREADPPLPPTR